MVHSPSKPACARAAVGAMPTNAAAMIRKKYARTNTRRAIGVLLLAGGETDRRFSAKCESISFDWLMGVTFLPHLLRRLIFEWRMSLSKKRFPFPGHALCGAPHLVGQRPIRQRLSQVD